MYFSRLEFQETLFVFSVNFERIDKENIGLNIKFTCLKKKLIRCTQHRITLYKLDYIIIMDFPLNTKNVTDQIGSTKIVLTCAYKKRQN